MAMTSSRGFTLLIAMIFVGVVLALAATLGALGYKQSVLAGDAIQSQYAFYVADAAMECALYADERQSPSPTRYASYPAPPANNSLSCEGVSSPLTTLCYNQAGCANEWISTARLSLDGGARCADLTFYEPSSGSGVFIFSEGYNTSCGALGGSGRIVARGLLAHY